MILNTLQTYIENAINQNADNIGGENYDATETYAVGDIVKYNGQLYICITAVATAENFDSQKWAEISLLETLGKKAGSTIDLSINSSTYVMTLDLKNSEGTTISTDSLDLPLESMVVNGTYDSTNKKIVLTLQSGSTIDVPVGDLVSGLQSEITNANKLSADLVDDTSTTNKFVTSAEKTQITTNATAISNIKDGSSIDSFGDVETALGNKQDTLVSGTSIKTINSTSLLGSGNIAVQETLVSGTNIKTINNESLLGSGNITIQGGGSSITVHDSYNTSTTEPYSCNYINTVVGNIETLLSQV